MTRNANRVHGWATIGLTGAAILVFVGIAGSVLNTVFRRAMGSAEEFDRTLLVALLLNIALILIGWQRQRDLVRAIESRSAAEDRALDLATRDPLVGFLNRRSLIEQGTAMLLRAERREKALALLVVDLDHFKTINDLHGHRVGDALLRLVAEEIAATMPADALTARYGGDQFACVFPFDAERPAPVERIAERIVSRTAQPFRIEEVQIQVSASIGIARLDRDCRSIEALTRAADIAMCAARSGGRNRFAWFDRAMERALQARSELEHALRSAIPGGEIIPYFEQQIDLATGRLSGFEVLARWDHPKHGLIGPANFVAIAEEAGMITDLSLSIMRQAFVVARDWDPALTLAVNISPVQLRDAWLPQKIIKVLTETGFPANRLEIEITESALLDNLALAQSIVGSLKNQGIRIALDDFGTGYSSLTHLRALPFDRIKIDRSFVTTIGENSDSLAMVKAIVGLGESLNLPVTAEGIADAAIEERLRAIGCARGQGYLYGQPVGIGDVRRVVADKRLLIAPHARDIPVGSARLVG